MSRNHRTHGNGKRSKKPQDARLRLPSKSTIWNQACDRAEELMDQNQWSEAREVLETVDRLHPGAECVLVRLAEVYQKLGEKEQLAAVKSRYKSSPGKELVRSLINLDTDFEDGLRSSVEPEAQEIVLLQFEIYDEPNVSTQCEQVQEWAEAGFEALQNKKGREAEVLFKKCLEQGVAAPDIMNNLAAAYALQGREEKSEQLVCEIHERWPDYFFGRLAMANMATRDGHFDVADQYLRPMLRQQRFHITEFHGLVSAYVKLEVERGRFGAAQGWLDTWKLVDPDHPRLNELQRNIEAFSVANQLKSLMDGFDR